MKTEAIGLEYLCDVLAESIITETVNTGGMLCHTINHPTIGKAQTVQSDGCALLLSCSC